MALPKRLVGPAQLPGAAATQYTVPADRICVIRNIHIVNPSGAAVTFTASIGADGAATRIFDSLSIAANSVYDSFAPFVLSATEILQAFAGAAATLVITVDGEEDLVG